MRAVNLLPSESFSRRTSLSGARRFDPVVAAGAAVTVAVLGALVGGYALEHSHASSAQGKLASARTELARLRAASHGSTGVPTPTLPTPAVVQQEQPWEAALTSALATRVAWDDVLAQLARVIPSNVTVTTVTLGATAAGTTPPSGSVGSLQLGGSAFSENGVVQLLSRLALVPDLNNIALTSSTADPKSGVVTFTVTADVGAPTAPSALAAPATGGTPS
jgi:Tfp pilus assembly protein PilN